MLRSPSLLGAQTSGFVPFGAGGSIHGDVDEAVRPASAEPALRGASAEPSIEALPSPASTEHATHAWRAATWAPGASARVRVVEAVVLAAIGGYFSLGLFKLAVGL
jgi:hypothetical protein